MGLRPRPRSPSWSCIPLSSPWPSPGSFQEMIFRQLWGGRAFVSQAPQRSGNIWLFQSVAAL